MNADLLNRKLAEMCAEAGAAAWGVAAAEPVGEADRRLYSAWLADSRHGPMNYMERYADLRFDPNGLLEGVRSIIVCAFSYSQTNHNPWISDYALGDDYHAALRRRLQPVADEIERTFGGHTRICVDSAPLRERYWAQRAGVGRCGLSGKRLVPGIWAEVFLAEILTEARFAPTPPIADEVCTRCGKCVKACPTGALDGCGGVDARRCLSCLTVEWRGPFPPHTDLHGRLVGCDMCSRVCPLSQGGATVAELQPRPEVLAMTPERALALTRGGFKATFAGSAIMRLRLDGLRRNAALCATRSSKTK